MATTMLGRWVRSFSRKRPAVPVNWAEAWTPHFAVHESYRSIRFVGELPGVRSADIEICIAGHRLIISGVRDGHGRFTRYFTLPANVDLGAVTSELRGGVLTILAPIEHTSRLHRVDVLDAV